MYSQLIAYLLTVWRVLITYKAVSIAAAVVILGGGAYYGYHYYTTSASGATRYVTETLEPTSISEVISGTGQVMGAKQVDLTPDASAKVTGVLVSNGTIVKAGQTIIRLDSTDAAKAVRDAQANLESAQLALEQLQQPATELELLQAQDNLATAETNKSNAEDTLVKSYEDGFTDVSDTFVNFPTAMTALNDVLFGYDYSSTQWNIDYYATVDTSKTGTSVYRDRAYSSYKAAEDAYDTAFAAYKAASRTSGEATIEALIDETYSATKLASDAIKDANNLIQHYQDVRSKAGYHVETLSDTHLSTLSSNASKINSHISALFVARNSIDSAEQSIIAYDRTIAERQATLKSLQDGPDALDVRSKQLTITQREDALKDAYAQYADYQVTAPFTGTVSGISVTIGEQVSGSQTVATLVSAQKRATISLNEVDITKVQIGQTAHITFDAVDGLELTGHVTDVDLVGAVSSGVVSYDVEVLFDDDDARIKPGMTALVDITVAGSDNALVVPNETITDRGDRHFVQVLVSGAPQEREVTVGVVNDTHSEILSGLEEGDQVITKTITSATTSSSTSASSSTRSGSGSGMGSGLGIPGMGTPPSGGPRE